MLPTSLYEKWSLRKMAAVFEGVEAAKAVGAVVGSAREVQRVVVASVASDSTVTYYIVHDGVVKPRQN